MCPALFEKCVGSLTTHANCVTLTMQEMGPMFYSPYTKRPEWLTICRCNYKSSTFSWIILRLSGLVWGLNPWQQTGALPTELTRRQLLTGFHSNLIYFLPSMDHWESCLFPCQKPFVMIQCNPSFPEHNNNNNNSKSHGREVQSNLHLSTFFTTADGPYIHCYFNLSATATSPMSAMASSSVCLFYWVNLPRGKEHEQDSGPMRGAPPYPTQTRKTREIDHNTRNYMYVPYSFRWVCGFFNVPC